MNHKELVDNLDSTLTTFKVGYGALVVALEKVPDKFDSFNVDLPVAGAAPVGLDLRALAQYPFTARAELFTNIVAMLLRSTIAAIYETTLDYTNKTGQNAALHSQPWYGFLMLLRHTSSHANGLVGNLNYWPPSLSKAGQTRVVWRHRMLDASVVGQDIHFSAGECIMLLDDVIAFAKSVLK